MVEGYQDIGCRIQGRHGKLEPGKAQYSTRIFLTGCIEIQNLGKAQALRALPAVAALSAVL